MMDQSDLFQALRKAANGVQDILRMLEQAQVDLAASDVYRLRLARAHALSLGDELEVLLRPSRAGGLDDSRGWITGHV
jgi:hypothetical protein